MIPARPAFQNPRELQEIKEDSANSEEGSEEEHNPDDEAIDEKLFLEAVASLNENVTTITLNSSEMFNSF